MMSLLNCYLPVFRFIADASLHSEQHSDHALFRDQCIAVLQKSLARSARHHTQSDCDEAYFAVVIWLDERVLCSPLEWVREWRNNLLQTHLFQISVGGEEFFSRLDAIEKTNTQLRMVYLFCLLMGFHGKYSWQDPLLLKQRIEDERSVLPEEWRTWPNEAQLIEQDHKLNESYLSNPRKFRHRKGLMISFILSVYIIMLVYGFGLFNRF